MKAVGTHNKSRAFEILYKRFQQSPRMLSIIKQDDKIDRRLADLCTYCLDIAMHKNGAFISSDECGIVFIFPYNAKAPMYAMIGGYWKLLTRVIGWSRLFMVLSKQSKMNRKRIKAPHLYCWALAVEKNKNGLETIKEIRDFIFSLSSKEQLPIVAETRIRRNLDLYKRYGFDVYDILPGSDEKDETWFISRSPQPESKLVPFD